MERKIVQVSVLLAMLAGCGGPADRVEGYYVSYHTGGFTGPVEISMEIKGDQALIMGLKGPVTVNVERSGDRIRLYTDDPSKNITLTVEDEGEVLTCRLCKGTGFPPVWERRERK